MVKTINNHKDCNSLKNEKREAQLKIKVPYKK